MELPELSRQSVAEGTCPHPGVCVYSASRAAHTTHARRHTQTSLVSGMKGASDVSNSAPSRSGWLKVAAACLVLLIVETVLFAPLTFSPYVPHDTLLYMLAGVAALLLVVALLLRRSERGVRYWRVTYALFVGAMAILASGFLSDDLLGLFRLTAGTPQWMAVAKFSESILRVVAILVLAPIGGLSWRSLYLRRGRVEIWLAIGAAAWVVFPVLAYYTLPSRVGMLDKLLPLWPWILLFVLSNGFMEELVFRGLFLQRYEPFLGKGLSNAVTALAFTLMHTQVTYAPQMLQFLAIALALSLIWGYLIQKTESLWGAALFHAAGDCLIIFAVFAAT